MIRRDDEAPAWYRESGRHAREIVATILEPERLRDVVEAAYLVGSRSTSVSRAGSDWDFLLIARRDVPRQEVEQACELLREQVSTLRAGWEWPGVLSIPKVATWADARRNFAWESATFGELFQRHAIHLHGVELRSDDTAPRPDAATRMEIARGGVARSLQLICFDLWRTPCVDGVVSLIIGDLARVIRAIGYGLEDTFPIDQQGYAEVLREHCGAAGDELADLILSPAVQGIVSLPPAAWGRLVSALLSTIGIDDDSGPARDGSPTGTFEVDRPIPWDTHWDIAASEQQWLNWLDTGCRRIRPALPPALAGFWPGWSSSGYSRSGYLTYTVFNRWNRSIEIYNHYLTAGSVAVMEALEEDLARVRHYAPEAAEQCDAVGKAIASPSGGSAAASIASAWADLCDTLASTTADPPFLPTYRSSR